MRSLFGLALAAAGSSATLTDVAGYVVARECWDRPGHVGVDLTPLGTAPETHRMYCMLFSAAQYRPPCEEGYVMLRSLAAPDANNYTYGLAYALDAAQGTQAVIDLLHKEFERTETSYEAQKAMGATSRRLREQFRITGEVSGTTLNVYMICFTPVVDNPGGKFLTCITTARGGNVTASTSMVPTVVAYEVPTGIFDLQENGWLFLILGCSTALLLVVITATAVVVRRRRLLAAAAAAEEE